MILGQAVRLEVQTLDAAVAGPTQGVVQLVVVSFAVGLVVQHVERRRVERCPAGLTDETLGEKRVSPMLEICAWGSYGLHSHSRWYRPVSCPSDELTDFPTISCLQPRQLPLLPFDGRRDMSITCGGKDLGVTGTLCVELSMLPCSAGSRGDSGCCFLDARGAGLTMLGPSIVMLGDGALDGRPLFLAKGSVVDGLILSRTAAGPSLPPYVFWESISGDASMGGVNVELDVCPSEIKLELPEDQDCDGAWFG